MGRGWGGEGDQRSDAYSALKKTLHVNVDGRKIPEMGFSILNRIPAKGLQKEREKVYFKYRSYFIKASRRGGVCLCVGRGAYVWLTLVGHIDDRQFGKYTTFAFVSSAATPNTADTASRS